jgi:uncharacterized protein YuzB (UPF0349 family)
VICLIKESAAKVATAWPPLPISANSSSRTKQTASASESDDHRRHQHDSFASRREAELVPVIANALNLSRAEVHGVISFYHDFRTAPANKPIIKLCRAEACQARGVEALVPQFENDDRIEVETVYCLGLCASGPAAMVGERVVARLDLGSAARLIEEIT